MDTAYSRQDSSPSISRRRFLVCGVVAATGLIVLGRSGLDPALASVDCGQSYFFTDQGTCRVYYYTQVCDDNGNVIGDRIEFVGYEPGHTPDDLK